jgi:dTDP-4-dehydrorhamnose reductase
MRILILGGDGMLGHQLLKHLTTSHEVKVTVRQDLGAYEQYGLFHAGNTYAGIDVRSANSLTGVLTDFQPQKVINAVGIIKQRPGAKESIPSIEINSLFPHRLAVLCDDVGSRMLHLSTDCVFSGKKGMYREEDVPDAEDLYGRSKLLGEVDNPNCLTMRTSMIGRELSRKQSLLEWFLAQERKIKGFKRAIFSGFTTIELSRIIEKIIVDYPEAGGLYHVSAEPISKFDLLALIKNRLKLPTEIEPDEEFVCDRSLDSTKFRQAFGYSPPSWEDMVDELCEDICEAKK